MRWALMFSMSALSRLRVSVLGILFLICRNCKLFLPASVRQSLSFKSLKYLIIGGLFLACLWARAEPFYVQLIHAYRHFLRPSPIF